MLNDAVKRTNAKDMKGKKNGTFCDHDHGDSEKTVSLSVLETMQEMDATAEAVQALCQLLIPVNILFR